MANKVISKETKKSLNMTDAAVADYQSGVASTLSPGEGRGLRVGTVFTIEGVNSRSWKIEDREGRFFEFETDGQPISFGAIMSRPEAAKADFWDEGSDDEYQFADGVKPSDVCKTMYKPSVRRIDKYIDGLCDGLVGKKVRLIAVRTYTPEGLDFESKVRAFEVITDGAKKTNRK